ncbi:DUF58 domain-containing protein [Virgibacillus flavescens]|uniref:DUF58 domain-containing protein n=1 Tax=Virgibacillus flavescens TaxID=1611422 RepID=UPI003D326DF2
MHWQKNTFSTGREYAMLLFFIIVIFIIAIAVNRPAIFLVAGFISVFMLLNRLYDKQLGKKLSLENNKRSIRMFEGEESEFDLVLKNESILPFINGYIEFTTDQKVNSKRFVISTRRSLNHYHVPLLLMGKSEARIPISFLAKKRGVVRLKNIQFSFPHIMKFEQVTLNYSVLYQTELLIYPKLIPVAGMEDFTYNSFGNQVTQVSPFEDLLSPVGTRDYVPTDPFHRIHWKASAKNQVMQTKVYERNRKISWTVVVNITESSPLGNIYMSSELENYLSYAAYICHTITKKGYPIDLYLNATGVGRQPFYLESGSGTEHLKKALELLSRIENDSSIMSVTNLLHRVDHMMDDSNIVVIVGEIYQESFHYTNKWNQNGKRVFQVIDTSEGARLSEVKNERVVNDEAQ